MEFRNLAAALALATLAACGGGGGGNGGSGGGTSGGTTPTPVASPTPGEAARFLEQASFGPTQASINALSTSNFSAWLDAEFAKPQTLHKTTVDQLQAGLAAGKSLDQSHFFESFWKQAVTGDDQLRQRVALALSEIFVVSFDGNLSQNIRGMASYYDMLGRNAFGNYRQLIEDVAMHPMMGIYLSHLRNQKENPAKGRVPDENFAREVMQLFSIGLYELNADGTQKLGSDGKPIETYTNDDVTGLAKVFTGWSWAGPDTGDERFWGWGADADPDREVKSMQGYTQFHSLSEKKFLGVTVAAQSKADPAGSLKPALDRLYNHANVGPFIGKQLIQRLVTSNPSPAYVSRVSAAFANNGQGVRGDMKAVIRAVLLDPEARDASYAVRDDFGKVREPIVRLGHFLRAFNATSASGRYLIGNTDSNSSALGQSPLRSPSVFNFYRPGYVPPGTALADRALVAPEFQITNETSIAGYLNFMQGAVASGVGSATNNVRDVQPDFTAELALAEKPDELLNRLDLLLTHNTMSATTKQTIRDAVNAIAIPTDATKADTARKNRVRLAVYLVLASNDYLIQK
ncbi:DUF1800 domain-containing protein [Niveibacterium microcysteis]|uniref:DUF1800 domain-containing protein n=1 Tax=Niveibacterium microcysteis TaxID=2811415 RepID=A0ABX7M394_9RHOO|nr:DUF1800 domain-containing protein [Niveibacterium microcysteis]QSI76237.1 DUF1800 domain-containing protein [Niveibacterium microcysteis]